MSRRQIPGVYQLPSGRWAVRLWVAGVRRYASFLDRVDAESAAHELHRSVGLWRLGIAEPETTPALTLEEAFREMVRQQKAAGRSPLTISQTEQAARLWKRAVGDPPVPLEREYVTRFLAWLAANSTTKGRLRQACLVAMGTAHRLSGLAPPPVPRLVVPRGGRRILTSEQFAAFVAALPRPGRAHSAAALVYLLAAREAEILRLGAGDVDLRRRTVTIWQGKGAERGSWELPILPELAAALEGYRPRGPRYIGASAGRDLRVALHRASRAAGVAPVNGLGWLRNQAATALGEAGVRPEVLSRVLRHASSSRGLLGRYDRSQREAEVRASLALLRWPTLALAPQKPLKSPHSETQAPLRVVRGGRRK